MSKLRGLAVVLALFAGACSSGTNELTSTEVSDSSSGGTSESSSSDSSDSGATTTTTEASSSSDVAPVINDFCRFIEETVTLGGDETDVDAGYFADFAAVMPDDLADEREIIRATGELFLAIEADDQDEIDRLAALYDIDGDDSDAAFARIESYAIDRCGFAADFFDSANSDSQSYGDDAELDALYDNCESGDNAACDDLYWQSPVGSEYEEFGQECAGRGRQGLTSCEEDDSGGNGLAGSYGDDAELDALYDACEGGDNDACDDLFWDSPLGSEYEDFGNTCGGREPEGALSCSGETRSDFNNYGDDADLDAMYDACAGGDNTACDDLYFESPIGSEYEDFGGTCGGRNPDNVVGCTE